MTNRIIPGWNRWREMSGVICDKKVPEILKNKIYKTAITPAMTYGGECWAIIKCEQNQMNTIEMKMLKWIQGKQEHITSDMLTSGKRHTQSQYILSP